MKHIVLLIITFLLFPMEGMAKNNKLTAYLFVYFTNNSPEGEQLRFAVSRDGFHYTPLNNGKRVVDLDNVARWKCIRDPHILRGEDGKSFYIVATDMKSSAGWSSNDGIIMMKSKDLVHWQSRAVDFPTVFPDLFTREGLTRVWAPQTIYDAKEKKYMVYYSLENNKKHLTIYYSYANKNFTSLSRPEVLVDYGKSIIDGDIVRDDKGTYHMFLAGIWQVTAPSLKGPWSQLDETKKYQQTSRPAEGPGVFRINHSNDWILMYDCFMDGYYQFCKTSDFQNFKLEAQTKTQGAFTPRHGTVIGITEAELNRLLKTYPSDGLTTLK